MQTLIVFQAAMYRPLTFHTYVYPDWANALGFLLTFLVLAVVPLYALFTLRKAQGATLREVTHSSLRPNIFIYIRTIFF